MRHLNSVKKLGMRTSHRNATLANLAMSVLDMERVITTVAKAKSARSIVERLITLAKRGETPESFFGETFFTNSHDNSIKAVAEGLADETTGAIVEDDQQLVKFHGMYLQDDRDLRGERSAKKMEKAFAFMLRVRISGGVESDDVVIEVGVAVGERVAVAGALLLKGELMRAELAP